MCDKTQNVLKYDNAVFSFYLSLGARKGKEKNVRRLLFYCFVYQILSGSAAIRKITSLKIDFIEKDVLL
jgi:hypothetical protein